MKIYYINKKIVTIVLDKDLFMWENTTNNASVFEIDEVALDNKEICIDLVRTQNKVDIDGNNKYYIENGELFSRDGWEEHQEEIW